MKDIEIIRHMKEDIDDIIEFTKDCDFDKFCSSHLIRKGICMSLINIGELTKVLSADYKDQHKSIPWKNISGLRDVTAHKYHTLNLDVIWAVAIIEIPKLNDFVSLEVKD